MASAFPRREFIGKMGRPILAAGLAAGAGIVAPASGAGNQAGKRLQLTNGGVDFHAPPDVPAGEVWHYGLTYPFQVAERKAAVFCNIRSRHGHDSEAGSDVILFDRLGELNSRDAVAISRNHQEDNPHSNPSGKPAVMVKYPVAGGFVPLGARRADGTAHPHAGTGFGISTAIAWTPDRAGVFEESESYDYLELYQFSFDGTTFKVTSSKRLDYGELLKGFAHVGRPISNAMPDGDDLLLATSVARPAQLSGCGVTRWRKSNAGWKPVQWTPVTKNDGSFEPTLIRDLDGRWLFCARGVKNYRYDIRVWRSANGRTKWKKTIHAHGAIPRAPISINLTAAGPYIASNLYEVFRGRFPPGVRWPRDAAGRAWLGGLQRDKLCFWPLNQQRNALEPAIVVRDGSAEFGNAPGGMRWGIDHPSSAVCQLADGHWRSVMGMRIVDWAEVLTGAVPTPQTGAYLEEVVSKGELSPAWLFG